MIFGITSTIVSIHLKFEELQQLMNYKQGILEIKEPTLATLVPTRQVVHGTFFIDFCAFRAKMNETMRENVQ